MGILANSCNLSVYTAQTDLPEDFLNTVADKVRYRAFIEIDPDSTDERSVGWVDLYDMLDNQFEKVNFLKEPYIVLGFRVDTRVVPSSVLKRCCLEAENVIKKTEDIRELPKVRRNEIKEAVKFKLLKETVPSSKVYDIIWNYSGGYVFFTNTSGKVCDEFQSLFYATFEVRTAPNELALLGSTILKDKKMPDNIVDNFKYLDIAGAEFLEWLWYEANGNGFTFNNIDMLFDGRVVLRSDDTDSKETITCIGDSQSMKEIDIALENGRKMIQAKLMMISESGEWVFTLDALYFDFKALKPPKIRMKAKDDLDGLLYEKIYLLEEVTKILRDFYTQFVTEWGKRMLKGENHVD